MFVYDGNNPNNQLSFHNNTLIVWEQLDDNLIQIHSVAGKYNDVIEWVKEQETNVVALGREGFYKKLKGVEGFTVEKATLIQYNSEKTNE